MKPVPNPDLAVGEGNKQRWNQPSYRRHGFHNTHLLVRRALMFRSRFVLPLQNVDTNSKVGAMPEVAELTEHSAFSAFVCAKGDKILLERHAKDFSTTNPHSIQSITKMHIHLIVGTLIEQGRLDLEQTVSHYLPDIGSGYADARVQDLLDMNVINDFSEDYSDPNSDCYSEEIALGWRLPPIGVEETTLQEFANGITGENLANHTGFANYKSANTDVLTLICSKISTSPLRAMIEQIVDAAGYDGSFHISTSPDLYPAFSGGGCLSARDLARFGLLITRRGMGVNGVQIGSPEFLDKSLHKKAPSLPAPRDWMRYSNHLMTDGRWVGHAGYGGQFLLVDMERGTSFAYLSVLENNAGYDDAYMHKVSTNIRKISLACS